MLPGIGHFIHEKLTISAKPKDDDYFNNEDSLMQEIHQEKTPLNILSNIVDNDTNKRNLKLSTTIDIKKTNKINNELSDGASKPNYSSEFPTIKRYLKRSSRFIQTLGSVLSKEKEEIKCKSYFIFFRSKIIQHLAMTRTH